MKHILTIAAVLMATTAGAGGLSDPIVQPPVSTPAASVNWSGAYIGGAVGASRTTSSYEEHAGYLRECQAADRKWGGKCTVSQDDWDHSPELLALGEPVNGHPSNAGDLSTDFRYDAGYPGVWVNDSLTYTSQSDEEITSNYAQNTVIADVFRTVTDEAETATYGAFAGYRHAVGPVYVGAEVAAYSGEDDPLLTAELTGSFGFGKALAAVSGGYAQMGDADGTTYGAAIDCLVTDSIAVGVKAYAADFNHTDVQGVVARVSINF